jgi:hypothetical protein
MPSVLLAPRLRQFQRDFYFQHPKIHPSLFTALHTICPRGRAASFFAQRREDGIARNNRQPLIPFLEAAYSAFAAFKIITLAIIAGE